ncbi:MAG: TlpA family protein disulfide reductase, partial [Candidatus Limnocylindria bacterium]
LRNMSRIAVLVAAVVVAACAPSPSLSSSPSPSPVSSVAPAASQTQGASAAPSAGSGLPLDSDPLHGVELFDVNTQTGFTLGALAAQRPVLLEMMAIWCTNCRAQQREVVAAHELAVFDSVSLDIDPNERPGDLAAYSADMGFGWRFALANQTLAAALRDRFGPAVLNPPSTPMILLFPDGSVRALEFRAYSATELAAEIAAG